MFNNIVSLKSIDDIISSIQKYYLEELYLNDYFDIRNFFAKRNKELSGGEKQKISLLLAILKNPDVFILDEPSSAMDEGSVVILKRILNQLKISKIIILISHDKQFVDIADDIIRFE